MFRKSLGKTRAHNSYVAMRARCENENCASWINYGCRGIKVCKRWRFFREFYKDMGPRPAGRTLDRINNNKGYSPGNCRWATWKQQSKNKRGRGNAVKCG